MRVALGIALSLALCCACLPPGAGAAGPTNTTTGENAMRDERAALAELYRNFYRFKITADTAGLDAILAPDFTLTHMTGFRQSRADWLAEVADGRMQYFSAEEEGLDIERDGDKATIVSRNRVGARIHGAKGVWNLQLTMRAVRSGGKWIIADIVAASY